MTILYDHTITSTQRKKSKSWKFLFLGRKKCENKKTVVQQERLGYTGTVAWEVFRTLGGKTNIMGPNLTNLILCKFSCSSVFLSPSNWTVVMLAAQRCKPSLLHCMSISWSIPSFLSLLQRPAKTASHERRLPKRRSSSRPECSVRSFQRLSGNLVDDVRSKVSSNLQAYNHNI